MSHLAFRIYDCKSRACQELNVVEKIGEGTFGDVYKVEDNRHHLFMLKIISCKVPSYDDRRAKVIQDLIGNFLFNMSFLRHPHIVQMYSYDFDGPSALLVFEFCPGGNLNTRLLRDVDTKQKFEWMSQLLEAMSYLHNRNFVHRDLKPTNVLLGAQGQVKLSDFSIARPFLCRNLNEGDEYLSEYEDKFMDKYAGTMYWVAPEVFDRKYNEKADIFSLGVTFYAILTRKYLNYQGTSYFGAFVRHQGKEVGLGLAMYRTGKNIEPDFEGVNDEAEREVLIVVKSMLCFDYNERISLDQAQTSIACAFLKLEKEEEKSRLGATANVLDVPPVVEGAKSSCFNFWRPTKKSNNITNAKFNDVAPNAPLAADADVLENAPVAEDVAMDFGPIYNPLVNESKPQYDNDNVNKEVSSAAVDTKEDVYKNFEGHYSCPIDFEIVRNAVECHDCHQLYCEECVRNLNVCPNCRQKPFRTQPNENVRQFIGNLKTECPNEECHEKPTKSNLQEHLKKCEWGLVSCQNNGCEIKFRRADLLKHLSGCSYQRIPCISYGCGELFLRKDVVLHNNTCLYLLVDCKDCHQRYVRKDEVDHFASCKHRIIECPICHRRGERVDILHHGVDGHYEVVASPMFQSLLLSAASSNRTSVLPEMESRISDELNYL